MTVAALVHHHLVLGATLLHMPAGRPYYGTVLQPSSIDEYSKPFEVFDRCSASVILAASCRVPTSGRTMYNHRPMLHSVPVRLDDQYNFGSFADLPPYSV